MDFLLNTHALLWFLANYPGSAATAKALIEDSSNRKYSHRELLGDRNQGRSEEVRTGRTSHDVFGPGSPPITSIRLESNFAMQRSSKHCRNTIATPSIACWLPSPFSTRFPSSESTWPLTFTV